MDQVQYLDSVACTQEGDNFPRHQTTIINRMEELRRATQWLYQAARQLGLRTSEVEKLDFCLNELLTNIMVHGYADLEEHAINISLSSIEKRTLLTIEDDGKIFNPVTYEGFQMPGSLEEATASGYGIALVRSFVDELSYERIGNKNLLTISLNHAD
ncbi:MAG: ATP-binding protein [Terriglobia bacterium]